MSDFQSMPAPHEGYGAPSRGEKPASIKTAINIIWALVALSVISSVISLVYIDDLVDLTLESAGGSGITEETARGGAVVGVGIGLVIGVLFYALLAFFIGKGKNWARIVVTVLGGLGVIFGLFGLATSASAQPVVLTVVSVLSLVLTAALIFFLWKKESSQWLTGKG